MSARIAIASIGLPDPYIRKSTNNERINMWVEQMRASAEEKLKDKPELSPTQAVMTSWFLPPIALMKLAKPETIEFKGKDGKKYTKTLGYRIIDGVHRYLTSIQLGLDAIDADEMAQMTPGQAYAMQYKLNQEGPLPFDREARDNAIRQMAKFTKNGSKDKEFTLDQIAAQTGISKSQVSRILSGKAGVHGEAYAASRKAGGKGKAKKGGARSKGGYDSADFFNAMRVAARDAKAHLKVLGVYLAEHDKVWEPCEDLIEVLVEIRDLATKNAKDAAKAGK